MCWWAKSHATTQIRNMWATYEQTLMESADFSCIFCSNLEEKWIYKVNVFFINGGKSAIIYCPFISK